ncbi:hypothetical protein N7488_010709 [Penicillium malachiteum]|nr:hypothetical protein N7488_010709 [Penicillium malachiteum]
MANSTSTPSNPSTSGPSGPSGSGPSGSGSTGPAGAAQSRSAASRPARRVDRAAVRDAARTAPAGHRTAPADRPTLPRPGRGARVPPGTPVEPGHQWCPHCWYIWPLGEFLSLKDNETATEQCLTCRLKCIAYKEKKKADKEKQKDV